MGRQEQEGKGDEAFLLGSQNGSGGAKSHSGVDQAPKDRDSAKNAGTSYSSTTAVTWRSLPNKKQLLFLGLCRLSEPLSNTALLAYVYYLLQSVLKVGDAVPSDASISRHSGLLIAVFPLAQFATSLLWGYLSDIHGRKSVVVAGLMLSIIANLGFGFSHRFGALVFWRFLAGVANGNTGVMRTMTAEIVKEKKYQARAFLLLPLIFNTGRVVALAMGGCLADPAVNIPSLFGPEGLFNGSKSPGGVAWVLEYRYALQPLMNAVLLTFTLLLAVFGLKETFPWRAERESYGKMFGNNILHRLRQIFKFGERRASTKYYEVKSDDNPQELESEDDTTPSRPPFSSIWTREVIVALISYGLLPLHNNSFTHLFPLFLSSPLPKDTETITSSLNGGLALSSQSVGLCLSLIGISGIIFKFLTYPSIQARFGTLKTFRVAMVLFPLSYICAPLLALLRNKGDGEVGRWVAISAVLCTQVIARGFAIPSATILLTDAAASRSVLGSVHGAGNMLASLARAVGPVVGGVVFAWGVEHGYGSTAWWAWLTPISIATLLWSYIMTPSSPSRTKEVDIEMS